LQNQGQKTSEISLKKNNRLLKLLEDQEILLIIYVSILQKENLTNLDKVRVEVHLLYNYKDDMFIKYNMA